jgi:choline dehydrogenase
MLRLVPIALFLACGDDAPSSGNDGGSPPSDGGATGEFEYIVVGAGAGGGPLAANLARAGHSVLLLEAGEDPSRFLAYQVPAFHGQATELPELRWDYFVRHYEDEGQSLRDTKWVAGEEGILYPRAGGLGGCTSHNAMITVYPHESDWRSISTLTGDPSWAPSEMRSHFRALERNRYLDPGEAGHGYDGWLQVERPDPTIAIGDTFVRRIIEAAAIETGEGVIADVGELIGLLNRDLNTAAPGRDAIEGMFQIPLATRNGQRNGTREVIVETVDGGSPLTVRTSSLVTRVLFDETDATRAVGVEYLEGASLYRADPRAARSGSPGVVRTARASREVILSAGAFNTPQLLMLSGIGLRADLEAIGIDVRIDLPGVGRNLQDRYEVGVVSEMSDDFSLIEDCSFDDDESNGCLVNWRSGEGVYTSNGAVVGIVHRSTVAGADPDLIIFGIPGYFAGYEPGYAVRSTADRRHFTWAILEAHTENRGGYVRLRTTDPRDRPEINFRYFHEGTTAGGEDMRDLTAMIDGVEFVREMIDTTNTILLLDDMTEVVPGPAVSTREQIGEFVRNESWGHHACCTAAIGADADPMAVLDSRFRVRGATNLRVVDASVFPEIPGFFIVVPTYMVSEKAAAAILEDLR